MVTFCGVTAVGWLKPPFTELYNWKIGGFLTKKNPNPVRETERLHKPKTPHQLPEVMSQVIAGARHCRQGHKMDTELGNRVLNMQLSPSQLSEAAGSIPSLCMTPSTLIFKYMCQ